MQTVEIGNKNNQVIFLQKLLQKDGYIIPNHGSFDTHTDRYVKEFQQKHGLAKDGIVGKKTWTKLLEEAYSFTLGCTNYPLEDHEWVKDYVEKDTIYLHHTAGEHRPDYTIDWWEKDKNPRRKGLWRIGTAFVIGRLSKDGMSNDWDGKTLRAFNEIYWAYHLGTGKSNDKWLNQKSIGIELCSLGGLHHENSKFFFKSKNRIIEIPSNNVCELEQTWRGFKYFQKYTKAQLKECEELILTLAFLFDIPLKDKKYDQEWFSMNQAALNGEPGLWTHANVRSDKIDCFPQKELIDMLNKLHSKARFFIPKDSNLEKFGLNTIQKNTLDNPESNYYSLDLMDLNIEI